jgi:hypothetical protein
MPFDGMSNAWSIDSRAVCASDLRDARFAPLAAERTPPWALWHGENAQLVHYSVHGSIR